MRYPVYSTEMLGNYLRGLRLKAGLTQTQAGGLLNLSQQGYQRLESNPGVISVERLMVVLKALGAALLVEESTPEDVPAMSSRLNEAMPELESTSNVKPAIKFQKDTLIVVKPTGKKSDW